MRTQHKFTQAEARNALALIYNVKKNKREIIIDDDLDKKGYHLLI